MAAGRSYDDVLGMRMADVNVLFEHWEKYPPTNEILAAVHRVGAFAERSIKPVAGKPEGCLTVEQLRASMADYGGLLKK